MDNFQDESLEEDSNDHYGVRDGTFFIIDATPPMFQNKTQDGIPYFLHCIQEYINVLKQKLMWNRQDWMGLALLGTEKFDPETKNVLTIQKIGLIKIEQLKEAIEIYESKWETYRDAASKKSYPLHDALWMAARALIDVKIAMPIRRVVFLTCQDVPPIINENEKHAIRNKVKSYSNLGLQLSVVGLGKKWNPDRFYKDLEILSGKSETEDYKNTTIEDLMNQVKKPSRVMAKLPWRLGNGVILDVSIRSLCVKVSYLKKIRMSQDTNVPLESHTHYRKFEQSSNEDEKESLVLPTDIKKIQTHGGRNICFTKEEVQSLCHFREPGLDLIGFKPIAYDPLYHMEAPKFLTCAKSSRKDNLLLFGALLNKCDARNLMAVCTMTIRNHSPTNLFCLIPCVKNGGFYLYKLAFKENVRNMNNRLKQYIYNNIDNKPPTTEPAIELATKLVKNMTVHYDPNEFPNPKLQVQQQNIETLALNLEHRDPPVDKTLPDSETIQNNVGDVIKQFMEILQSDDGDNIQPPSKRFKRAPPKSKLSNESMSEKVQAKEVEKCTAQQLKEFLSSVGLEATGLKAHLVQRVYEHFANKS